MTQTYFLFKNSSEKRDERWFSWYSLFIEKRKDRERLEDFEDHTIHRHHILPRCLGGDESPFNRIRLTLREHKLAHKLLSKAFPESLKLRYACHMLENSLTANVRSEMAFIMWADLEIRNKIVSAIRSPENLRRISEASKKHWLENKERTVEALRNSWADPTRLERQSKRLKNYFDNTPDAREKLSNTVAELWKNEEYREKQLTERDSRRGSEEFSNSVKEGLSKTAPFSRHERAKKARNAQSLDPDYARKQSEKVKATFADPAKRAHQRQKTIQSLKDPIVWERKRKAYDERRARTIKRYWDRIRELYPDLVVPVPSSLDEKITIKDKDSERVVIFRQLLKRSEMNWGRHV